MFTNDYEQVFEAIDTNHDGVITADELRAMLHALSDSLNDEAIATMIGFIDTDGDGKITREQLEAYLTAR